MINCSDGLNQKLANQSCPCFENTLPTSPSLAPYPTAGETQTPAEYSTRGSQPEYPNLGMYIEQLNPEDCWDPYRPPESIGAAGAWKRCKSKHSFRALNIEQNLNTQAGKCWPAHVAPPLHFAAGPAHPGCCHMMPVEGARSPLPPLLLISRFYPW